MIALYAAYNPGCHLLGFARIRYDECGVGWGEAFSPLFIREVERDD